MVKGSSEETRRPIENVADFLSVLQRTTGTDVVVSLLLSQGKCYFESAINSTRVFDNTAEEVQDQEPPIAVELDQRFKGSGRIIQCKEALG